MGTNQEVFVIKLQKKNQKVDNTEKDNTKKESWLEYIIRLLRNNVEIANEKGLTEEIKKINSKWIIVFSTIAIPYLKAVFYTYQRGRFSVYDISERYIAISDNVIQESILYVVIAVVFLFFVLVNLAITPRKGRILVNIKNHIFLYCFQYLSVLLFACPQIKNILKYFKTKEVETLLAWVLLAVLMMNIFPFLIKLNCRLTMRNKRSNSSDVNLNAMKIGLVFTMVIAMALIVVFSYCWGRSDEQNKTQYKYVREDKNDNDIAYKCADGYAYYAIIDEQANRYILCALKPEIENGHEKYIIDKERKKIIENTNVEVGEL